MQQYEVNGWLKTAEIDVFEDGCQLDGGTMFQGSHTWHAPTVANLVEQLRAFVPFRTTKDSVSLNACDEDGRIDISGMETNDGSEPTESEIARWKRGELQLWYVTYAFMVERVTRKAVAV